VKQYKTSIGSRNNKEIASSLRSSPIRYYGTDCFDGMTRKDEFSNISKDTDLPE